MKIGIAARSASVSGYLEALRLSNPRVRIQISLQARCAADWDALLLPGGGDIDPLLLPGAPPTDAHCADIDPELDRRQLEMLDLFVQRERPVLGICKGMQLINLYFGGGLCQHLPSAQRHRYAGGDQLHSARAAAGSLLAELYGTKCTVNSAHHQGVLMRSEKTPDSAAAEPAFCGPGQKIAVIQWTDDGVAEGILHESLPILGLQWHPERLCGRCARADAADGGKIFERFLAAAGSASRGFRS